MTRHPADLLSLFAYVGLPVPRLEIYGFPLGYGLERVRNALAMLRPPRDSPTSDQRTAASGRWLQPADSIAPLVWAAAVPFQLIQRVFASGSMKDLMNPFKPMSEEMTGKLDALVKETAKSFIEEMTPPSVGASRARRTAAKRDLKDQGTRQTSPPTTHPNTTSIGARSDRANCRLGRVG